MYNSTDNCAFLLTYIMTRAHSDDFSPRLEAIATMRSVLSEMIVLEESTSLKPCQQRSVMKYDSSHVAYIRRIQLMAIRSLFGHLRLNPRSLNAAIRILGILRMAMEENHCIQQRHTL